MLRFPLAAAQANFPPGNLGDRRRDPHDKAPVEGGDHWVQPRLRGTDGAARAKTTYCDQCTPQAEGHCNYPNPVHDRNMDVNTLPHLQAQEIARLFERDGLKVWSTTELTESRDSCSDTESIPTNPNTPRELAPIPEGERILSDVYRDAHNRILEHKRLSSLRDHEPAGELPSPFRPGTSEALRLARYLGSD